MLMALRVSSLKLPVLPFWIFLLVLWLAVINLYAIVEINHCSVPREAHRAVSLPMNAFPLDTPQGPRELPVLSMCCAVLSHSVVSNSL